MDYKVYRGRRKQYSDWRSSYGREYVDMLRSKQFGLCFICLLPLSDKTHIDHIQPLYKDGKNRDNNLALTHPKCNILKGISELLGKKEISHRKHVLFKIGEGVRFYKLPHHSRKQQDAIIFASEYIDLAST